MSKKVGGAVVRNRMKRRFRELARAVLPAAGIAGADHVLVGRAGGIERPFAELQAELVTALKRLAAKIPPHDSVGRGTVRRTGEGLLRTPCQPLHHALARAVHE